MFIIPHNILVFLNKLPLSKGPVVVGVSGGADSLYLTFLLNQWCKKNKRTFLAVTVNHELRTEALDEANWVHKQLTKQKIDHTILAWEGTKPKTHIEERAREKRYELLLDFCHKHKATALFLAHHQQDQVETFWTRLAHSSGLDGLGCMTQISKRDNIMIVRPLLKTSKQEIIQTLQKNHVTWIEDPMNQDTIYERVQWRQNQPTLDKMGLNAKAIEKATERLQRAKEALNFLTQEFLKDHLKKSPLGFVQMSENTFMQLPEEMRIRVVIQILKMFNDPKKIISLESAENLALQTPKYATLSGCQWVISHHSIFVAPELKHLPHQQVLPYQWIDWGIAKIWTNKAFTAEAKAPIPRAKDIPYLIQRTFLNVPKGYATLFYDEKELEKKVKLDYKNKAPVVIFKLKTEKENA